MTDWLQAQKNSAPYVLGSRTSRAAAERIAPSIGPTARVILDVLDERGPMTEQEIEIATGFGGNTVRPRLVELRHAGKVRDSGYTGKTASGRDAVKWEAIQTGQEQGTAN